MKKVFYQDTLIIIIIVSFMVLVGYLSSIMIKSTIPMPVEIRDVTEKDLQLLIDRAKVSGNTELESILHAVAGALETGTLSELADYTTKYSKHMLEDHYKSIKKLNTI